MKMYVTDKQIRLVGKAWEVRHQLRKLKMQAGSPDALLAHYFRPWT